MKRLTLLAMMLFVSLLLTGQASAQQWVASWTASVARSLSGRQSDRPARTQICLRVRREGRPQPVVPHDRAARCLGAADAHPALQCLRHPARHLQRRFRRPAGKRQRGPQGNQPAGSFRRPEERHRPARPERGERRGGAAVRQDASRSAAQGTQARGQLPCRGRERPDDLARQGAADLLPLAAGLRPAQPGRGRERFPLLDDLLVLPRRGRHEPAGQGRRHRGLRRFDHRRHGEHASTATIAGRTCCRAACTPPTATTSSWSTRGSAATRWSDRPSTRRPSRWPAAPARCRGSTAMS